MRQPGILVLRASSFLVIVLQHIIGAVFSMPGSPTDGLGVLTFLVLFSRFAVPAFIFAAGYVSVAGVQRDGAIGFYRKRVRTVLVPYVLWSTAFFFFNASLTGTGAHNWASLGTAWWRGVLWGEHSYHLWFMVTLVQLYVVLPALVWLLSRNVVVAASLVVFVIAWHVGWSIEGQRVLAFLSTKSWASTIVAHGDRLLAPWLAWGALGAAAARFQIFSRGSPRQWLIGPAVLLLVTLVLTLPGQYEAYVQSAGDYYRTNEYSSLFALRATPLCIAMMLMIISLGQQWPPAPGGALTEIDRVSFVGYLTHPFALAFSIELVVQHLAVTSRLGAYLLTGTVTFALALLIAFGLSRVQRPVAEVLGAR